MSKKKTLYRIVFTGGSREKLQKEFEETLNILFKHGYVLGGRRYKSIAEYYSKGGGVSDGVLLHYDDECRMMFFLSSVSYDYGPNYNTINTTLEEFLEKYQDDWQEDWKAVIFSMY